MNGEDFISSECVPDHISLEFSDRPNQINVKVHCDGGNENDKQYWDYLLPLSYIFNFSEDVFNNRLKKLKDNFKLALDATLYNTCAKN